MIGCTECNHTITRLRAQASAQTSGETRYYPSALLRPRIPPVIRAATAIYRPETIATRSPSSPILIDDPNENEQRARLSQHCNTCTTPPQVLADLKERFPALTLRLSQSLVKNSTKNRRVETCPTPKGLIREAWSITIVLAVAGVCAEASGDGFVAFFPRCSTWQKFITVSRRRSGARFAIDHPL